jgi:hypothetical protein
MGRRRIARRITPSLTAIGQRSDPSEPPVPFAGDGPTVLSRDLAIGIGRKRLFETLVEPGMIFVERSGPNVYKSRCPVAAPQDPAVYVGPVPNTITISSMAANHCEPKITRIGDVGNGRCHHQEPKTTGLRGVGTSTSTIVPARPQHHVAHAPGVHPLLSNLRERVQPQPPGVCRWRGGGGLLRVDELAAHD